MASGVSGEAESLPEEAAATPPDVPAAVERPRARGRGLRTFLGVLAILFSLPAFASWIFQVGWSGGAYRAAGGPNYLSVPSAFWSSALFAIALGLFFEGVYRLRRP